MQNTTGNTSPLGARKKSEKKVSETEKRGKKLLLFLVCATGAEKKKITTEYEALAVALVLSLCVVTSTLVLKVNRA